MDSNLIKNTLNYAQRRKKWIVILTALGFTSYGAIRVYNSPYFVKKRERLFKLLGALASLAELLGDSAETVSIVSKDLKEFIKSESDEIPNSLKQLSKITRSEEVCESIVCVSRALTLGILRGHRAGVRRGESGNGFADRALDKLFSPAGSGFVSVVVGSFAKNMVLAIYRGQEGGVSGSGSEVQKWVDVIAEEKCKRLIGDCIQQFVSTLVTVYLDKTMDVNPYDQIMAGLTNPKHEEKVRDLLSSFCNGAIETLVKTGHQVIYNANGNSSGKELVLNGKISRKSQGNGFVSRISSTLAVPSNRSLVLDVTGRVTFATVRSFLDFFLDQLSSGVKRKVDVVHDGAIDKGREVYKYVSTKSYTVMTICLSVWLHVLSSPWSFASGLRALGVVTPATALVGVTTPLSGVAQRRW
nr:protein phloem protein 2-like A10 [Tanacetum cinerariifolium]